MSTEEELTGIAKTSSWRQNGRRFVAVLVATLMSASSVALLSSCGFSSSSNTILVRVQGTPGIPYEVKLDAGNDTDVKRGNGDDEFTFTTDDCLVTVSVNSNQSDTLYVGLWINDEYDDRDTSNSGYVIVSGSCL
jgi:hypothetical protein